MKIHPHQALQALRRMTREVESLTERLSETGSKQALAGLKDVLLSLVRAQKTVQSDVNARRKLKELHDAQLRALRMERQ